MFKQIQLKLCTIPKSKVSSFTQVSFTTMKVLQVPSNNMTLVQCCRYHQSEKRYCKNSQGFHPILKIILGTYLQQNMHYFSEHYTILVYLWIRAIKSLAKWNGKEVPETLLENLLEKHKNNEEAQTDAKSMTVLDLFRTKKLCMKTCILSCK